MLDFQQLFHSEDIVKNMLFPQHLCILLQTHHDMTMKNVKESIKTPETKTHNV